MRTSLKEFSIERKIDVSKPLNLLPETADPSIFPGCSTLSYEEAAVVRSRIYGEYATTKSRGGMPSIDSLMQDIGWIAYLLAFETEKTVRENQGDMEGVELLKETVRQISAHETIHLDVVSEASALLSTNDVINNTTNDIISLIQREMLALSYYGQDDMLHFMNSPRGGFSCV